VWLDTYGFMWIHMSDVYDCIMYRMSGEDSEMRLCDAKSLSMTTLRMTAEAKV